MKYQIFNFEQDEKDGFTYFEDIYHQNGKRVR